MVFTSGGGLRRGYPAFHKRAGHVQRNHFSASTNEIPPHTTRTNMRPGCAVSGVPSRIVARSASLSAVSGSALISG